jgi:hypothetical protein
MGHEAILGTKFSQEDVEAYVKGPTAGELEDEAEIKGP